VAEPIETNSEEAAADEQIEAAAEELAPESTESTENAESNENPESTES
jgi:hypothetical protein